LFRYRLIAFEVSGRAAILRDARSALLNVMAGLAVFAEASPAERNRGPA